MTMRDIVKLTDIEKFYYLRSSLKDKAAEIVKSIETTTDNYNDAWAAIKERFEKLTINVG